MRNKQEKELIALITGIVKAEPDSFTFKHYDERIEEFARHKEIVITIRGRILLPFAPRMKEREKRRLRKILKPIYERECSEVLDNLTKTLRL